MAPKPKAVERSSSNNSGIIPAKVTTTTTSASAAASPTSYPSSSYASTALALMSQDWSELSLGDDPVTAATSDFDRIVDRVTALLLIRIVAIVAARQDDEQAATKNTATDKNNTNEPTYPDWSTSTICRHVLLKRSRMKKEKQRERAAAAVQASVSSNDSLPLSCWPKDISTEMVDQLKEFVKRILKGYKDVPYHSCEHAYHVIVSTNKLLDLIICPPSNSNLNAASSSSTKKTSPSKKASRLQVQLQQHLQLHSGPNSALHNGGNSGIGSTPAGTPPPTTTFGLRHNPLALFSLVFSALVHDVEHQGIPNRQLAMEDDRLAILYNDQSIAENWSLYVAFSEFLQDEFSLLRQTIFGGSTSNSEPPQLRQTAAADDNVSTASSVALQREQQKQQAKENYRVFRKHVVNLVLHTDIASPERTQVGKSKWKEAFGEPHETVEAKVRHRMRQQEKMQQSSASSLNAHVQPPMGAVKTPAARRMTGESGYSEITFTPSVNSNSAGPDAGAGDTATPMNHSPGSNKNNKMDRRGSSFSGDEQDSMSGTPDTSFHADEDGHLQEVVPPPPPPPPPHNTPLHTQYKEATGGQRRPSITPRRQSMEHQLNDLMVSTHSGVVTREKFGRRMSNSSQISGRYRQRLGILRTVDLSGETLETYSRHGSMSNMSTSATGNIPQGASSNNNNNEYPHFSSSGSIATAATGMMNGHLVTDQQHAYHPNHKEADEPDELRMTVVMETIMTAADVAHNLQGWGQMAKWSGRLYQELRKAHVAGRGPDVSTHWFENQIGFLESYLLPLARRLEDTGVFGEEMGSRFARIVEENRDKWLTEGYDLSQQTIAEGAKRFPMAGG